MGNLLEELKRRKVYRISGIYAVVAWSLIQVADVILPTFYAPQWVNQALILALLAGFPIVAILAWMYEFSASGIKKTQSSAETESVVFRKRDYISASVFVFLIGLVISQQVFLLTRQEPVPPSETISAIETDSETDFINQILRQIDVGDNFAAFRLALDLEQQQPGNSELAELRARFSTPGTVLATDSTNLFDRQGSEPESLETIDGAEIWIREYSAHQSDWLFLGTTPLNNFPLPNGNFRLRLEKPGYFTREFAMINPLLFFGNQVAGSDSRAIPFPLDSVDGPENMVSVPRNTLPTVLSGFSSTDLFEFGAYQIDKYEVSNSQYQEFVDIGGYEETSFWEGLEFIENGEVLSWSNAMNRFIDSTGRFGPAGWELGRYLPGTGDYPVSGISWYEAVAYGRFRDKELPTIHHWTRAAYLANLWLGTPIVEEANFAGAPVAADDNDSVSPWGAYNMAGNVREWTLNPLDEQRLVLGGTWSDQSYMSSYAYSLSPMVRDNLTGFRLAKYSDDNSIRDELRAQPELFLTDYRDMSPPPDDLYTVLAEQYDYSEGDGYVVAATDFLNNDNPAYREEKFLIQTGYDESRFALHVFTPKSSGPYDPVIYFGNGGDFSAVSLDRRVAPGPLDFIPNSGRALIIPVFHGSFDRYDGFNEANIEDQPNRTRDRLFRWRTELGRVLDYLLSRNDMTANVAYFGWSFGASMMTPLLALEPRLKTAVLVVGGFPFRESPPIADPLNFVNKISQPILMLNGRLDPVFPLESRVRPFYDMLGTDEEQKRLELFDMGHSLPPRNEFVREVIDWLDRYQ